MAASASAAIKSANEGNPVSLVAGKASDVLGSANSMSTSLRLCDIHAQTSADKFSE